MKYFFNILIVLVASTALAQEPVLQEDDTSDVSTYRPPKVKHSFVPTGLRLSTDLISIGQSIFSDEFQGWEVNADVDFYRYYLAADYGYWSKQLELSNGTYSNSGTYYRIGADVNFLLNDPDRNMFFLGYRYGQSVFDDHIEYAYTDGNYGTILPVSENTNLKAHWMELTTGLRVKIYKFFWMGYTARFKFMPRTDAFTDLQPYDIPGYGLYERKTYWGFNYQIFFRIPFKKEKLPEAAPAN